MYAPYKKTTRESDVFILNRLTYWAFLVGHEKPSKKYDKLDSRLETR
jgi:hypothetical protein